MGPLPLAEFLERTSLENQLFWTVKHTYKHESVLDIQWVNYKTKRPWRAKFHGESSWRHFSIVTLVEMLKAEHWDINQFNRELATTLLTQAVYAEMVLAGAKQLLGEEAVAHAVKQTESFLENIKSIADKHLPAAATKAASGTEAKVIAPVAPESPKGLRVIRNDSAD